MKCSDVIEILGSYCRGELTDSEAGAVSRHLASCPECTREHQVMARVMGALGDFERIEPRADFALRLSEKIDAWEARKRIFWLGAIAGFVRSNRRVLAAAAAVFVFSLIGSIFVIQQMGPGGDVMTERRMASPGEVLDGIAVDDFAMTEVSQPASPGSDSVYMHYVTGDRPAYPGEEFEDYVYRPVVRTVSVPGQTY
jgi:hypothetical protein